MHRGVASGYAHDQRQLIGAAGRLLYHHRSSKGTGGYTILAGDVHGNAAALVHLHHPQARGEQRRLEREAAPDKERNQVISSGMFNLLGLLDQLAILVDAILRNIDSKVRIAGRDHRPKGPRPQ